MASYNGVLIFQLQLLSEKRKKKDPEDQKKM